LHAHELTHDSMPPGIAFKAMARGHRNMRRSTRMACNCPQGLAGLLLTKEGMREKTAPIAVSSNSARRLSRVEVSPT